LGPRGQTWLHNGALARDRVSWIKDNPWYVVEEASSTINYPGLPASRLTMEPRALQSKESFGALGGLTMRIHSHSSLGSFESCPRQYWYQYIGKPPVERVDTIEAFLGTCVHETLETLYRLRLRGRVLSQEEALEAFESAWAKLRKKKEEE